LGIQKYNYPTKILDCFLNICRPVTALCQTFEVHRSSYRHWQASANEPDGERVVNRSRVMEAWNASGGSAGFVRCCNES
ncbi:hypothetical protein ACUWCL_29160, partial [Klebsiella pneumoniae]